MTTTTPCRVCRGPSETAGICAVCMTLIPSVDEVARAVVEMLWRRCPIGQREKRAKEAILAVDPVEALRGLDLRLWNAVSIEIARHRGGIEQ